MRTVERSSARMSGYTQCAFLSDQVRSCNVPKKVDMPIDDVFIQTSDIS